MKIPQLPDFAAIKAAGDAELAELKAERDQMRALATARHDEMLLALDRVEAQLGVIVTALGGWLGHSG